MDTSKADVSRLYKPQFSFFGCGYINKQGMAVPQVKPFCDARLPYEIYRYIKGEKARQATLELRQITDEKEARRFKVLNFRAFTPQESSSIAMSTRSSSTTSLSSSTSTTFPVRSGCTTSVNSC